MRMRHPSDALCLCTDGIITWGHFAADVMALRKQIAPADQICNVLLNRYDFMVGLAAAILNEQTTVLPSSTAPQAVLTAISDAENPLILGRTKAQTEMVRSIERVTRSGSPIDSHEVTTALDNSSTGIDVFTSGSTKTPMRYRKDWRALVGGAAVTQQILSRLSIEPGKQVLLGTTPHGHMYGLESTAILPLGFGHCVHEATVFYPADIDQALDDALAHGFSEAFLLTSPTHLKFLESTLLRRPEISAIISSTGPLSVAQAERLEDRGNLPVMEIYGSTETGALAIRRTIQDDLWEPVAEFKLNKSGHSYSAAAPHLAESFPLSDDIDLQPDGRFRLLGRRGDMVAIAGKRTGLAVLNAILIETPHLLDGVVLRRETQGDDQLVAVIVIDGGLNISPAEMRAKVGKQFDSRVDAIFSPRRIIFVDSLRRTPTSKIPLEQIERLHEIAWPSK